jgi:hypothetical protein
VGNILLILQVSIEEADEMAEKCIEVAKWFYK